MSRDIVVEALWRVTAWGVGGPGRTRSAAADAGSRLRPCAAAADDPSLIDPLMPRAEPGPGTLEA